MPRCFRNLVGFDYCCVSKIEFQVPWLDQRYFLTLAELLLRNAFQRLTRAEPLRREGVFHKSEPLTVIAPLLQNLVKCIQLFLILLKSFEIWSMWELFRLDSFADLRFLEKTFVKRLIDVFVVLFVHGCSVEVILVVGIVAVAGG